MNICQSMDHPTSCASRPLTALCCTGMHAEAYECFPPHPSDHADTWRDTAVHHTMHTVHHARSQYLLSLTSAELKHARLCDMGPHQGME
jgi:hypothetical protein